MKNIIYGVIIVTIPIFLIVNLTGVFSMKGVFGMKNETTNQLSKKKSVFEDITNQIFKYKKPIKLGVESGVDVTNFYEEEVFKYADYDSIISDLINQGFVVKIFEMENYPKEQKEIVAVKHNPSFILDSDRSVSLRIIISQDKIISVKAIYFNSAQTL
mgnify:CR=1 FL=1